MSDTDVLSDAGGPVPEPEPAGREVVDLPSEDDVAAFNDFEDDGEA